MKNDAWSNKELHQNASKYVEQTKQSKLELGGIGGGFDFMMLFVAIKNNYQNQRLKCFHPTVFICI